jgi:hypothetical protein
VRIRVRPSAVRQAALVVTAWVVLVACTQAGDQVAISSDTSNGTVVSQTGVSSESSTTSSVAVVALIPSTLPIAAPSAPATTLFTPPPTLAPPTTLGAPPPTDAPIPPTTICARSNIDFAALRSAPGVSSPLLAQIPPGDCTVILLTPQTIDAGGFPWYNVEWAGIQGWCAVSNMA